MSLAVYGEIALDLLVHSNNDIYNRCGGAGLYASIAAAKQDMKVEFLTVYNSEILDYQIFIWNSIGVTLDHALKNEEYELPKYLVTGYRNYEHKISRPMSFFKNNYNYYPEIPKKSQAILIFPIGHTIPLYMCEYAQNNNILVFLDPKPNEISINEAKKALKYTDILLVNEDEAMLLSNSRNIKDAINILSKERIKHIVIKRGIRGCILISEDRKITKIPSFRSNAICTLGSGDVFDGALAATFLETKDIVYSIEVASCLAASFIEKFEIERMPNKLAIKLELKERKRNSINKTKEVVAYLAGPFFSEQELYWVNYVKQMLELRKIKVLSPFHSNGIVKLDSTYEERKRVFNLDIELLEKANIVIALIDHNDPGTYFEMGYALKKGVPIIGYKTSVGGLNNMISCGCSAIVSNIDNLIEEVEKYVQ
ncbi:Sugar or nucleoside kinase, ribokinase family [Clostridium amylolyticum]|uniref:Sugar or nucleoside kinase, ribokinase family n=1 Tax=Clostridium amylolyticum TaxID=1121298 RepID=A0A1M6KDR7_9CLOT|nr:PfkB family carbohydrate kinase [Clostridium amylolyticum]SHJ56977.1 Sugar or nucleoside kinase, ribokinase family [Clostridium amylolyticum]